MDGVYFSGGPGKGVHLLQAMIDIDPFLLEQVG
jgi:hypothetical protein